MSNSSRNTQSGYRYKVNDQNDISPPRRKQSQKDSPREHDDYHSRRAEYDNDITHKRRKTTSRSRSPLRRVNDRDSYDHKDNKLSKYDKKQKASHDSRDYQWGNKSEEHSLDHQDNDDDNPTASVAAPEIKPDFGLSGALAKDERTGNMKNGIVLNYSEALDSTTPDEKWRLYVFKGEENIEISHIHRQSSYLLGRDERVADIILAHPSCSKQHAVIQYRLIRKQDVIGSYNEQIKPYLMDLNSANKTILNGQIIESARYYELLVGDCIKFGSSTRDYIVMNEDHV